MLLQEWLEELRENVLRDVSDVLGSSSVELWSDATLVRYLDEGYKKFCKGTLLLRDATTRAVTQITLASGTDTYPLHKSVLSVISARLDGNAYDLRKTTHDALAGAVDNSVSSGAVFAAAAAGVLFRNIFRSLLNRTLCGAAGPLVAVLIHARLPRRTAGIMRRSVRE